MKKEPLDTVPFFFLYIKTLKRKDVFNSIFIEKTH